MKNTVETRINELNKTRAAATGAGGGAAAAALAAANVGRKGKAMASEISGAIRSDKQDLRMEELQLLFS